MEEEILKLYETIFKMNCRITTLVELLIELKFLQDEEEFLRRYRAVYDRQDFAASNLGLKLAEELKVSDIVGKDEKSQNE